ncbi:hypothetical protein ACT9XH_01970 [Methanococcoides methylutens]|uniref:hypothetical protein n=1 Tax=Methanococcoides methylutens TaxID=2226 RepID=UPI004044946D
MKRNILFVLLLLAFVLFSGCITEQEQTPEVDRYSTIPADAIKMTPGTDNFPPQLHSEEYEQPVPLAIINTAGAEDSPFIPSDRNEIYFFFTPDVRVPVEKQILDGVTGIYVSKYINGSLQEPERVMLQKSGKLALDGCEFVQSNTMLFCSAREGYTGLHWFSAEFKDGRWTNWKNADFHPAYEVGELHIHDDELYYHSPKEGGKGGTDIWMLTKVDSEWTDPVNVNVLNSEENEGMPYVTVDGNELWFNRWYMGTPAVFRSKKVNGKWQEPELIISQFAGEPTLDKEGNVYFVHHFYEDGKMIEADIYVAYRK